MFDPLVATAQVRVRVVGRSTSTLYFSSDISSDMRRTSFRGLFIAAMLGISWSAVAADPCDPGLIQPKQDPNAYQFRGDRCEGIYLQPLAGSAALLFASFTEAFQAFDPRADRSLQLEWIPVEGAGPTRLRAYGLRSRQYYRMDADRPAGMRSYSWPTTILSNLDLSRELLGVIAWNEVNVGSQSRRVHLPLRIGAETARVDLWAYQLILVANVELTEVSLTLTLVDDAGRDRHVYLREHPLGYGYYPPNQGIRVPITGLNQSGFHRLKVAAKQRDRGSSTDEFWFYHPRK
jgi:hypothetical protein